VLAAERESLLLAGIDATERLRFEQMVDRMIRTLALVDDAASMPQASEGSSGLP
jgi:hypothetical protein